MRPSITLWLCLLSSTATAVPLRLPAFVPVPDGIDADNDLLGDRLDGFDALPLGADGCPVILTDSLCQDPAFWDTPCGQLQLADPDSACADPLRAAMSDFTGPLDQVLVYDPITGELVQIPLLDPDETVGWNGFDATFSPVVLSTLYPGGDAGLALGLVTQWWDQNCSVQSCEEYAFEAYQDYSSWESTIAAPLGRADWRQVFESAYAADGIARRTLYSSDGDRLPTLSIDARRDVAGLRGRRNAFIGFSPDSAPASVTPLLGFSPGLGTWSPTALVPWVLEILGELPDAATGPEPLLVDVDVLTDVTARCRFSDTTGHMLCDPGALSVSREIADRFNAHLVPFDATRTTATRGLSSGTWPPAGDPWDVHRALSDSLVATPDETLLWLERRQEQFLRGRQTRQDAWADLSLAVSRRIAWNGCVNDPVNDEVRCLDTVSPAERATRALQTLREADLELSALLDVGAANGCFGPAPTPCDWSPRWPALAFVGHFQEEREELYQTCITRTGNDFRLLRDADTSDATPHWLVSQEQQRLAEGDGSICASIPPELQAELADCAILDDYMTGPRAVTAYFDTVDAWVETLSDRIRLDPETGRPSVGESAGDRLSLGTELFGADLVHDAGWLLTGLDQGVCSTGGEIWGRFGAGARVLGLSVPPLGSLELDTDTLDPDAVLERRDPRLGDREGAPANLFFADLHSRMGDDGGGAHVVLDLLGQNLYAEAEAITPDGSPGYRFHWAEPLSHSRSQTFIDGGTTFFVGPVPVNLAAGAAGSVGFTAEARVDAEVCTAGNVADVAGAVTFRPSVGAYGFADASAGISGLASVGVDSNLTLAEAALPLVVSATGTLDPDDERGPDDPFTVSADLDLELTLLRGRVRVYVELLTEKLAKTLLVVPGITETLDLFDTGWSVDLAALASAIDTLDNTPDPSLPNDGLAATESSPLYEDRGVCIDPGRPAADVYLDFNDSGIQSGVLEATSGNAGLTLGSATTGLPGLQGQAIEPGPDGLPATAGSVFGLGPQRAWSLWFAADSAGGTLLSRGTGGDTDQGIVIELLPDGRLQTTVACVGEPSTVLTGPAPTLGDWHHVALSLGLDGVHMTLDGDTTVFGSACPVALSGLDITVGAELRPGGATQRFDGSIDELGYWGNLTRPFVAADARELHQQGLDGLPLAGTGSAPLTGITDLDATLSGTSLSVDWTPPPSLADPAYGYTSVVVTVGRDDYVAWDGAGLDRYEGTASSTDFSVGAGEELLHIATYGITTTGVVVGPRRQVRRPLADLPDVTNLMASPAAQEVALSWTLPGDPRVASVWVVRGTDGPPTSPDNGVLVFQGRARSALDVGLPTDAPVHYTLWTLDGVGRRSPGVSLSTATVSGVVLDTTPPAPVLDLEGEVTASRVALSWQLPADPDPLQVEITRGLASLPGQIIAQDAQTGFIDDGVAAGVPYTWTLRTVDPAGNRSTPTIFQATPRVLAGLALLDASVQGTDVELLHAPVDPGTALETRIVRGDVVSPADGVEICRQSSAMPVCTDTSAPVGVPVVYTGFVYDGLGVRSEGLTSLPVTVQPSATAYITGPTQTHVGALVRLGVDAAVSSPTWTLDGPRLLDADSDQPWFRASTPGSLQVRLDGMVDGAPITETVDIDVQPYTGATSGFADNPFVDVLLPGHDRLHMAVDGDRVWATRRSFVTGDALVSLDRDGSLLTSLAGTWPRMRHASGLQVVLADDFGSVELWRLDGTPALLGSESLGHGAWQSDLDGTRLAYAVGNQVLLRDVSVALTDLGTLTLPGLEGITAVALSHGGDVLHVARGQDVETYDLAPLGLGGAPVIATPTPVHTRVGTELVAFLATDNDRLAVLTSAATSTLSIHDVSVPAAPVELGSTAAGAFPAALDLAHGHALVQGRNEALAFSLDPLTAKDGLFAHPSPVLASSALVAQPGSIEVWLSSETFSDEPTTGITTRDVTSPLPILTQPRLQGVFASAVPAFANQEEHWAAVDFSGLLHGDPTTLVQTPTTPDFGFFDTLCVGDDDVLVVQDPGLVTRMAPLTGATLSTWTLPAGCDRLTCSGAHVFLQCGTTWVAADRATGTLIDTTNAPATDSFAAPDQDALIGLQGSTVVARTLVAGQWTTGQGDGLALAGFPGFVPAALWQGALYAEDFAGLQRFDLTDGSSSSVTPVMAIVDPAAGLAVSVDRGSLHSRWLEEDAAGGDIVTQHPAPNDFDLSADGGHAFTLDGSSLGEFETVAAFLTEEDPTGGLHRYTLTWTGPDSQPICQVTGGSCTIDSVQSGSATVSWMPPTSGDHELTVAVGDVRWMATARARLTVGGAP